MSVCFNLAAACFNLVLPVLLRASTLCVQEALGAGSASECVLSFVEMLLPVLLELLKAAEPAQGDAHFRKRCRRLTHVTSLLLDILHLTVSAAAVSVCMFA